MADQEHLALLQQGVKFWNQWRKEHPDVTPDLRGADFTAAQFNDIRLSFSWLTECCFSKAQLQRAYFVNSDLLYIDCSHADLTEAHLDNVKLKKANLRGAKLQRAKIRTADLSEVDLSGADLSFANLDRTSLRNANLHQTDLSFATLCSIELFNVDLSTTKGLDTVIHKGVSHLGIQTLSRSLPHLPAVFLQSAGVSDTMLSYIRSLKPDNPLYATCLLCYANEDRDFALKLQADLQAHGVFCNGAPYDIEHEEVLEDSIQVSWITYDMVLIITSEYSETKRSRQFLHYTIKDTLLKEQKESIPVLIPMHLRKAPSIAQGIWANLLLRTQHQSRDFTHWQDESFYQPALEQLLHDLKAVYKAPGF